MKKIIIVLSLLALSFCTFSCGGGSGSSNSPKGENPGTPSIVQLLPSHFIAQTNTIITVHAKVLDGNGDPVRHVSVRFSNLSAVGVLSATSDKTDGMGIATVTLKSTSQGFSTIQAEVNKGVAIVRDRKTVFFGVNINLVPYITLDVDGNNNGIYNEPSDFKLFETPNDNQVNIRATVFDRFGQRAAFTDVIFGSDSVEASFPLGNYKTTNENGEAFVLVQVDPITIRDVQTVLNITALASNGAFNMVSLFLQPVVISNITVYANPTTVESGGTSDVTAFVTTSAGTPAPDGTTVSFTASQGGIDPFSQTTGGWTGSVTFTAPTVTTDTYATITASVGGISGSVAITIKGPPLSVTPPTISVDGVTGGDATFTISGGKPAYTITSNNPAFPPVPGSVATSGGTFTVTVPSGTAAATVLYTIKDTLGDAVIATLQITTGASAMTVEPLSAAICENTTPCAGATSTTATFTITGGTTPYTVTSDTPTVILSPGALPANTFTVDAALDSITANTTVTLTIKDNAASPATVTRTVTVINQ